MSDKHNAHGQYYHWMGSEDHYSDDEIDRLQQIHGTDTAVIGVCEGCGKTVHTGAKGYNEQVHSYVRYGPFFICSECILDAVDVPELECGKDWSDPKAVIDQ